MVEPVVFFYDEDGNPCAVKPERAYIQAAWNLGWIPASIADADRAEEIERGEID